MVITSFISFLLLFVFIGLLSYFKNSQNTKDYLLANYSVKPWLVALSGVATNNSGYMFVGMIGYTYYEGLSVIWLMVGWVLGDFLTSLFIHKKLRIKTEERQALSYVEILSNWTGENYKYLQLIGAIISVIFLSVYAAAQLKAGSKGLEVLFGWSHYAGAIIGAIIVLMYCLAGGIRASIWTDAAQSFVMIISMALLVYYPVMEHGGIVSFYNNLNAISPNYLSLFPYNNFYSTLLFIVGWLFAGFGVVGQPHIMVRFMSMNNPNQINRVRIYYYTWYILFYALTIFVGLAARLYLNANEINDAELALPLLAGKILPDFLIGMVIAGLFAATMSTADSQIITCTASLTRDLGFKKEPSYIVTKLITLGITLLALGVALYGNENVFGLVLISWSALASAFVPLLTILVFNKKVTELQAIFMVFTGIIVMLNWRFSGLGNTIYEIMPGIISGFLVYYLFELASKFKNRMISVLNT